MASGSGRPVRGPHPRDITSQTRTPAGPGAAVTARRQARRAGLAPLVAQPRVHGEAHDGSHPLSHHPQPTGSRSSSSSRRSPTAVDIPGGAGSTPFSTLRTTSSSGSKLPRSPAIPIGRSRAPWWCCSRTSNRGADLDLGAAGGGKTAPGPRECQCACERRLAADGRRPVTHCGRRPRAGGRGRRRR